MLMLCLFRLLLFICGTEDQHVVFLQQSLDFLYATEPGLGNFSLENLLACADVVHRPLCAFTLNPTKIHHDHSTSRPERFAERGHGLQRELKVMIGVTDECDIYGIRGQLSGVVRAQQGLYISQVAFTAGDFDVVKEFARDVHRDHSTFHTQLCGEQSSKQAGAGTDVGNDISGLQLDGLENLFPLRENFPAFNLKPLGELFRVGVTEGVIDAGADAFFLGRQTAGHADKADGKQQRISCAAGFHGMRSPGWKWE